MKLVMTLMVRDEADVLEAMIQHHRSQGVDHFVVTDNGSVDGTWEILRRLGREGDMDLRRDFAQHKQQAETVTQMARDAYVRHGADWVINADADEFWVAKEPDLPLRAAFEGIPRSTASFLVPVVDMTGPAAKEGSGLRRLIFRDNRSVDEMNSLGLLAHSSPDAVHVGTQDIEVSQGNHAVSITSNGTVPPEFAVEVLHYPWRSWAQFERKVEQAGRAYLSSPSLRPSPNHHGMRDYERLLDGVLLPLYVARHPSDDELEHGIIDGRYTIDTRIADSAPPGREDVLFDPDELERFRASARPLVRADARYLESLAALSAERNANSLLDSELAATQDRLDRSAIEVERLSNEVSRLKDEVSRLELDLDAFRRRRVIQVVDRLAGYRHRRR